MLKKLISHISTKKSKKNIDFFELPLEDQKKIIQKAAELSAQDQNDMLKEYERKFGQLQTNSCK